MQSSFFASVAFSLTKDELPVIWSRTSTAKIDTLLPSPGTQTHLEGFQRKRSAIERILYSCWLFAPTRRRIRVHLNYVRVSSIAWGAYKRVVQSLKKKNLLGVCYRYTNYLYIASSCSLPDMRGERLLLICCLIVRSIHAVGPATISVCLVRQ